ncbi:MAG: heavy metal translocating P-type ATPase [Mycobacteriaceae bacterium]
MHTSLSITGMTCASCAQRVERKLNKIPGVQARVNFATEVAIVSHPVKIRPADLIAAVEATGYAVKSPVQEDVAANDGLVRRVVVALVFSTILVPVTMFPGLHFPYWQTVAFALATPIVFWAGYPFHKAAFLDARHGGTSMNTLISVGTLVAYGWSLFQWSTAGEGHSYFEVSAVVTAFLLLGRYFESKAKRSAGSALRALMELSVKDVVVIRNGKEQSIALSELAIGDYFIVRPGEKIATDGVVQSGFSAVDASALTGESVPVDVGKGDQVAGSTICINGQLVVRAHRIGADTQIARIRALVESAQEGKANAQRLADRISGVFVPIVLGISVLTLIVWLFSGSSVSGALSAAIAVVIIACPCALGLATPTAILVGTGRGAQLGILIKGPEVLERINDVDVVVLDKTGTVTTGEMSVSDFVIAEGESIEQVKLWAASVESYSQHPIAVALAQLTAERVPVSDFSSDTGWGVRGFIHNIEVTLGKAEAELPRELTQGLPATATWVVVQWGGKIRGVFAVRDSLKASSIQAVKELKSAGMTPILLTGDHREVAHVVAEQVGIETVISGVLPEGKAQVIADLQGQGKRVAMVGDGVNDAAALAIADVGIAMGTGTDVAIEASDITLLRGDLRSVSTAIMLSQSTLRTIKVNLFWAFLYNIAAIPLAACGLLNPMIAGATMAMSSIFVILNSLRLRRFQ